MESLTVISDNQFFTLGIKSLLSPSKVTIYLPDVALAEDFSLTSGFFIVYIKNREMHRDLCRKLSGVINKLIFFLPLNQIVNNECELHPCFLSAKLTPLELTGKLKSASAIFSKEFTSSITLKDRIVLANISKGIDAYMRKMKSTLKCPKQTHRHTKRMMSLLGIYNVNVHNLFLSEYIAAGYLPLFKQHLNS
ncbi:hypothetical protein MRBLME3_001642 [Enterobacter ludwigii]|uniref:hypothetical protein n=1 Tax=Enterobacter ludwigii TaxID=299767 RepID=UPI003414A6DB